MTVTNSPMSNEIRMDKWGFDLTQFALTWHYSVKAGWECQMYSAECLARSPFLHKQIHLEVSWLSGGRPYDFPICRGPLLGHLSTGRVHLPENIHTPSRSCLTAKLCALQLEWISILSDYICSSTLCRPHFMQVWKIGGHTVPAETLHLQHRQSRFTARQLWCKSRRCLPFMRHLCLD